MELTRDDILQLELYRLILEMNREQKLRLLEAAQALRRQERESLPRRESTQ